MIQILLVDDDEVNNFIAKRMIDNSGFSVQTEICHNGHEALEYLSECAAEPSKPCPDVVFIDINMPIMSGWELLDELHKLQIEGLESAQVYLLSSSVHTSDISRAEDYPTVTGFISKPISSTRLKEIFEKAEILGV